MNLRARVWLAAITATLAFIASTESAVRNRKLARCVSFNLAGAHLITGESSFAKYDEAKGYYLVKGGD